MILKVIGVFLLGFIIIVGCVLCCFQILEGWKEFKELILPDDHEKELMANMRKQQNDTNQMEVHERIKMLSNNEKSR